MQKGKSRNRNKNRGTGHSGGISVNLKIPLCGKHCSAAFSGIIGKDIKPKSVRLKLGNLTFQVNPKLKK